MLPTVHTKGVNGNGGTAIHFLIPRPSTKQLYSSDADYESEIGEVVQSRRRPLLGLSFSWLKALTSTFTIHIEDTIKILC